MRKRERPTLPQKCYAFQVASPLQLSVPSLSTGTTLSPPLRMRLQLPKAGSIAASVALSLLLWHPSPTAALSGSQKLVAEAWRLVDQSYLDRSFNHVDWFQTRMRYVKGAYASIDDGYSAIRDMLKLLDDPYTRFLTPNQFSSLTSVATGRLGGVGIELFPTADPLTVSGPMEGGPADRAGVRARDVITNIDGETVKGLGIDEAVARIGGKAGTGVSLTVVHEGGKEQSFYIVREDVHVKSVKIEKLKQGEVVIRIKQFNTSTADDVREGMKKVGGGVKRIIVDVRNNAGGYFAGGVDVARLFMRDGSAIVHIVDRNGIEEEIDAVGDGGYVEVPMVVVVNKATASASEILTGALKDCGRAVVVGERTFGKGVVQTLLSMSDGSGVAITTARYETGGHHNINKVGISPDVESSCDSQADVHVCLPDGIWNKST